MYEIYYILSIFTNVFMFFFNPNSRFPFGSQPIFAYFLYNFVGGMMVLIFLLVTTLQISFFLNCCLLIEAGWLHIRAISDEIDHITTQPSRGTPQKINLCLVQLIECHIRVIRYDFGYKCIMVTDQLVSYSGKRDEQFIFSCNFYALRLVNQVAEVVSGPLFVELLRSIIMSSSSLLMMEIVSG